MATDRLEQLLSEADAAAPPPAHRPGMAIRVRRRAAQRVTNVRIAAGFVIALGVAGIVIWATSRQPIQVSERPTAAPTQQAEPEQSPEVRQRFAIELIRLRQEARTAAEEERRRSRWAREAGCPAAPPRGAEDAAAWEAFFLVGDT